MVRIEVSRQPVKHWRVAAVGAENKKAGLNARLQPGQESPFQAPDHREEPAEIQDDRFREAGRWSYGNPFNQSRRQQRVAEEVALLQEARFRVSWDQVEGSWVRVENFPLPGSERDQARLLIQIPPDFPDTPPNGVYIDRSMPPPGHYYRAPYIKDPTDQHPWSWVCFHVGTGGGGWQPSIHVAAGDNLLKYVKLTYALMSNTSRQA